MGQQQRRGSHQDMAPRTRTRASTVTAMTMSSPSVPTATSSSTTPGASAASVAALAKPPDGGWGWVVVLSSFMIHVIADGVTYTFGIFYLEFLKYFQESKGKTAWIASIMVGTTFCIGELGALPSRGPSLIL